MPTVLISGGNRGIGLEFARQYAGEGWQVYATARNPADAADLRALGERVSIHQLDVANERSIAELVRALAGTAIDVLLAAALHPNIRAGSRKIAIAISSLMASLAMNDFGTQYVYRASKTALNALWTTLALEWRSDAIACVLLRPGLVRTRMTNFKGDLEARESVAGMRRVIAGLSLADTGRFIGYDGKDVPW